MAVNKNALTRYRVLDRCFGNPGKKYYIQDLVEACNAKLLELDPSSGGIQKRQVQDDIKFMESEAGWNIPLERLRCGKQIYYRYQDVQYSIDKQPLNLGEIEKLKAAMQILTRFEGQPQFAWVHELMPKLEQNILLREQTKPIISFDTNQYLKGISRLGALFHHILYEQSICIEYQSFKKDSPETLLFHPYYLKQYNNRWFLLGSVDGYQTLTNLALDRILSVLQADLAYVPNKKWDFEEYFEDVVGVTRFDSQETVNIHLGFSTESAPYILSKPLHGSQKIVSKDESGLVISIEVIPNYELESLILSFGDRVQVLQPESVRASILKRITQSLAQYEGIYAVS